MEMKDSILPVFSLDQNSGIRFIPQFHMFRFYHNALQQSSVHMEH